MNAAGSTLQQEAGEGAVIDVSEAMQRIAYPRRVGSPRKAGSRINPARPARETSAWHTIDRGGLPHVLQMFPPALWESTRWTAPRRRILAAYGVGGWLAKIVNTSEGSDLRELLKSGKWVEAHGMLGKQATRNDDPHSSLWTAAALEAVLLHRHGFRLRYCTHGQHYYFADYHHQDHCPVHRGAGTQKKWRAMRAEERRSSQRRSSKHAKRAAKTHAVR